MVESSSLPWTPLPVAMRLISAMMKSRFMSRSTPSNGWPLTCGRAECYHAPCLREAARSAEARGASFSGLLDGAGNIGDTYASGSSSLYSARARNE